MVKTSIELDHRTRQKHFLTSSENRRLNNNRFKTIFRQLNNYFKSFGLYMRNIELVDINEDEPTPEPNLKITDKTETDKKSLEFDCQFLREMMNMSEKSYRLFEKVLSPHLSGIPKLHTSNTIKHQMNQMFKLAENSLGVYVEDPIKKIQIMLSKFMENNEVDEESFRIKISGSSFVLASLFKV